MGLDLVIGSPITAAMLATGERHALLSATLAELLFGSPADAIGRTIRAPMPEISIQGGGEVPDGALDLLRDLLSPSFTVGGVFADPSELQRRSYGIADMLVPATAAVPGKAVDFMEGFLMSRLALLVGGGGFDTIESQTRAALAQQYGDDVAVVVWEGQPAGGSAALEEARSTVRTFSLVVNLLGFVLLVTGCVGILSIMLVEVLGRTRQIAIARAFGATKGAMLREFLARSLILVGGACAIGVALSLVLSGPLTDLVMPIFRGVTEADLGGTVRLAGGCAGRGCIRAGRRRLDGSPAGVLGPCDADRGRDPRLGLQCVAMKITAVRVLHVDRYLYALVDTDAGITGLGESGTWGYLEASGAVIDRWREYLVGQDPLRIEHHWQYLYRSMHFRGAAVMGALSAIDIALWDIAGKHFGVPVHQLLGGRCRDRTRVYYHVFGETREDLVSACVAAKERGFTAVGHLSPFYDAAGEAVRAGDARRQDGRRHRDRGPAAGKRWATRSTCAWRSTAASPPPRRSCSPTPSKAITRCSTRIR